MKRVGFLFEKICSTQNILLAIKKSSEHKHDRKAVQKVLKDRLFYAKEIQKMLLSGDIKWGIDHFLTIVEPSSKKVRKITVPTYYPDQIIHWAIILVIEPYLKKGMTDACIGSVPDRGPLYGKKQIEKYLRQDKKIRGIYKADVHHFFESVRIDYLKAKLRTDFKDPKLLRLLDEILDRGCRGTGIGLPIGYYTSQWLSNYYLEDMDHFILEKLKVRYYKRYVDDIVILDTSKRKLHRVNKALNEYLSAAGLTIKGNWQVFKKHSRPLDFLGYKFYEDKTLLRNRIFFHLNRVYHRFEKQDQKNLKTARSLMSLYGFLKHIDNGPAYYSKNFAEKASKGYLASIIRKADRPNIK